MRAEKLILGILLTISLIVLVLLISYVTLNRLPPEGLTELYFAETPPKTMPAGIQIEIPFTIHNMEKKDMVYEYTVTVGNMSQRREVKVNSENSVTIPLKIKSDIKGMTKVRISLSDRQAIFAWVNVV